nr:helix-turn-helix transcriptional regulator [Pseudofrankia sp. BMG5.37]
MCGPKPRDRRLLAQSARPDHPRPGRATRRPRGRRVPGLRREEAARLAGVSTEHYTRLEQGRATNPSSEVIQAPMRGRGGSPPNP